MLINTTGDKSGQLAICVIESISDYGPHEQGISHLALVAGGSNKG